MLSHTACLQISNREIKAEPKLNNNVKSLNYLLLRLWINYDKISNTLTWSYDLMTKNYKNSEI